MGSIAGSASSSSIRYCYSNAYVSASGSSKGNGTNAGGIVGDASQSTVSYCGFSGTVYSSYGWTSDAYVGGIAGDGYTGTVKYCYNVGKVIVNSEADHIGAIFGFNSTKNNNNYYLDSCGVNKNGTAMTAAQFASGEVAYLLGDPFGQTIGTDPYPVLNGPKVYYGYVNCGATEKT